MSFKRPYPTQFEILRHILHAFDFKLSPEEKKHLDAKARDYVYDPREFQACLDDYFLKKTKKYFGMNYAEHIFTHITSFINEYLVSASKSAPSPSVHCCPH